MRFIVSDLHRIPPTIFVYYTENYKVQSLFGEYKTVPFMRRRAYKKSI